MSELQKVLILTSDSVDTLRVMAAGANASEIWNNDLDALVKTHSLRFIESEYEVDPTQGLQLSDGDFRRRDLDATNARQILRVLPNLTAADAVDERLWVTLALGHFRGYMRDRWPADDDALGNHVRNHVFASTDRRRERDHAIARLWWSGSYVRRFVDASQVNPALQAFFSNSDLSVQILGRPSLATIPALARAILAVVTKYFVDQEVPYDRTGVRSFLEALDYLAGRRALGTVPANVLLEVVEERFREHVELPAFLESTAVS
ncbi:DUF6339 family protein [Microbacterium sp. 4-7]|uniref:DUF6339 family protein n=1 Tax=Microbacterium sp. 4-7 TaxID=1885327 RepID=UPI001650AFD8|nr:DUF6339 family protein [Microbacterium sp. 4-7]MBC6493554.1 hypothetical protein [Microbacterium sp. 4-7]